MRLALFEKADANGRMQLKVHDPLQRTWEKGIYMGADSTHPDAVKRNRPQSSR